jgi:hypothetical protein
LWFLKMAFLDGGFRKTKKDLLKAISKLPASSDDDKYQVLSEFINAVSINISDFVLADFERYKHRHNSGFVGSVFGMGKVSKSEIASLVLETQIFLLFRLERSVGSIAQEIEDRLITDHLMGLCKLDTNSVHTLLQVRFKEYDRSEQPLDSFVFNVDFLSRMRRFRAGEPETRTYLKSELLAMKVHCHAFKIFEQSLTQLSRDRPSTCTAYAVLVLLRACIRDYRVRTVDYRSNNLDVAEQSLADDTATTSVQRRLAKSGR